ncbi:MAG TPA: hypothetical protein VLC47_08165 [Burkholderiales bacterium]|nr:hypothetical protein [Burkholderiales bacterium]
MKTKTTITTAAAATLLLVAPLAALANDGHGSWGRHDKGHGWKQGYYRPGYVYAPVRVQPYYYPVPRVVVPPVYVPVPAPVIAVPAPYPYPSAPVGNVSIGFRLFF